MLYHVSIHRPKPEHEQHVIDSMHRFGAAARTQDGLLEVHTLKDRRSDALVGLAVWGSAEALEAARPSLAAATEDDDFDAWEAAPIEGFLLDEV
jgi:heme-degrading monooxygenase HmoA